MPTNALTAGVAALAVNSPAFTIEIFRGGFAAVPVAQHDAARALGLRPAPLMAPVVVPQVFRIVLPPLGNQIVSVVLGSAQASIIGVAELTYQTQSIGSSTFRYFELFTIAALFYIACAQLISLVWRLLTGRPHSLRRSGWPIAFHPKCPLFMYFASKPASRNLIAVLQPMWKP